MTASNAIRPLVVGNWKMNGLRATLDVGRRVARAVTDRRFAADVMICPPATLIAALAEAARDAAKDLAGSSGRTGLLVGAQDCHHAPDGAHTGDIAAAMLADAGATAVILGHSERRSDHAETSGLVARKVAAAQTAGLTAIVCVGETAGERRAGLAATVIARQLLASLPASADAALTVVAYEPVWAIGTGLTAQPGDVAAVHSSVRGVLAERFGAAGGGVRILYGGSVKPANAAELMAVADVDGALVGGASLTAEDFLAILAAYHA